MNASINKMKTVQTPSAGSNIGNGRAPVILLGILLWFLRSPNRRKFVVLVLDIAGGTLSSVISYWLAIHLFSAGMEISLYRITLFLFLIFLIGSLYFFRGYMPMEERRSETELEIVVKGVSSAFLFVLLTLFVVFKGQEFSRYMLILWWLCAIFMIAFFRFSLRETFKALWKRGYLREKVLLVGSDAEIKRIWQHLSLQRHRRFEYVGIAANNGIDSALAHSGSFVQLGYYKDIEDTIRAQRVSKAFIFLDDIPNEKAQKVVEICKKNAIAVNLISNALFGGNNLEISLDEFTGFLTLRSKGSSWNSKWNRFIKRIVDIVGSLLGILIFGFLYPVIGLLIKISDKGPVLYRRGVVGAGGKAFDAFKFRTMCNGADELLQKDENLRKEFSKNFKLENDPRLIKPGRFLRKWSIDEVPQFLNVLKGQMSLVGPRMIVAEELQRYGQFQEKLLTAKPGVTGFWQVSGRQNTDYEERVRMDMFYIDHWSIWMDVIILIKTVWKVVKREGAY